MTIRKTLLLQLICLSSAFYCNAGTGSFTLGADVGPGFSALYGPSSYSNVIYNFHRVEPSVSAGINYRYNFPKIVSIGSGVYYCQFGVGGEENPDLYPNLNFFNRFNEVWNTINIPLLARASFGKKTVFFAETGPFLSIVLKDPGAFPDVYPRETINAGITVGCGVEVPLPHRFALNFEVCSDVGLKNIASRGIIINGSPYPYANSYIKTYSCTLLCGFNYTLPVTGSKRKILETPTAD